MSRIVGVEEIVAVIFIVVEKEEDLLELSMQCLTLFQVL